MSEFFSSNRRFAELIGAGEAGLDLAEAALVIAQEEYPLLSLRPSLERLDGMAERVKAAIRGRSGPLASIEAMNAVLFEEEGFTGNQDEYYDPRNCFLNEVLERKSGIPITLSVIYLEVARRAGLAAVGVGLPGHFIVRYLSSERFYLIDPFHQGKLLTEEDCREKVQRIYGGRMSFRQDYLRPVGSFAILARVLYNLKNIYVESKSYAKALSVMEKLVLLNPRGWEEVRDRGIVLYQLKHFARALKDLETYLKNVPQAGDRRDLMKLAQLISRRLKD